MCRAAVQCSACRVLWEGASMDTTRSFHNGGGGEGDHCYLAIYKYQSSAVSCGRRDQGYGEMGDANGSLL